MNSAACAAQHAARQRSREPVQYLLEIHLHDRLLDPRAPIASGYAGHARVEIEVLARCQGAVNRDRLRHISKRGAHQQALPSHIEPGNQCSARGRRQQRRQDLDRRRFAGTVRAQQPKHRARGNRERNPTDRLQLTEANDKIVHQHCRVARRHRGHHQPR